MMLRPNLAFPTQYLSRYIQQASTIQLNAAKGAFRYLAGTANTAIYYRAAKATVVLAAFSDSDFAGCRLTSKSTGGYLTTLNGGPISWRSKRSSTVVLSTLKAESDAMLEALREVEYRPRFL